MTGYLVRRLFQLIPVALVVSLVLFMLLRLMPGDPTLAILGQEATEQDRAVLREDLGLDAPLWQQFTQWLGDRGTLRDRRVADAGRRRGEEGARQAREAARLSRDRVVPRALAALSCVPAPARERVAAQVGRQREGRTE